MNSQIVFYSNYFSPYRDALWRTLGDLLPLEVRLARGDDAGRGWDMTEMSRSSYPVNVCSLSSTSWPISDFWLPNKSWLDLKNVTGVIVGGWEAPAYWSLAIKAKRAGIKTIGFYESTPETQAFTAGPIARSRAMFFKSLDAVVSSGASASLALSAMGVEPKSIFEGFNVVDHEYWNRQVIEKRTQLTGQIGHKYLYVGQLIERKGISDLLKAFRICSKINDTLRIVGSGSLHFDLQALVSSLDLQEKVTFVGSKSGSDLATEYAKAQTLVLASHKEVWGLVVNEALASGLHVVVTEKSGIVRSIMGMEGVFVVANNLEDRVSAIVGQMELSREKWSGWRSSPEILARTPLEFALVFKEALKANR